MRIILSPCRMDASLSLEKVGETLVVNGVGADCSGLADGQIINADETGSPFVHEIRMNDTLQVTVILPIGPDASDEQRFPEPIEVESDGIVQLP